jgi:serine/threonine protein kinase
MELVEGQTLSDYVNSFGPVRGAMMWALAEGLAEALSDIHDAGIVHRDLKPSNVLLGPDGVRVVDFGISVLADATSLTGTGSFVGTAAWLSPEQVQGDEVTEASDVFSLGMLLAYASSGYHPFGYGRGDAIMYRIVHNSPKLDDVSPSLREIVEGCLEKEVESRLTLIEVREMIGAADRSLSPEGATSRSSATRIVGAEEQINALIHEEDAAEEATTDTEICYDISDWPPESSNKLQWALQSEKIEYTFNGSELVVSKSDEDRVDELVDQICGLPPPIEHPNVSTTSGFGDSRRKLFFGFVASILLVGGVIRATSGDSEVSDSATATTVKRVTSTTLSESQSRLQQVQRGVGLLTSRMMSSLEESHNGADYSYVLKDGENALKMTDVLQLDCRGQWLINDSLSIAGFNSIEYDQYFTNYLEDTPLTDNLLATRVAVTVLHSPSPRGSFVGSLSYIIGGDSVTCNDSDFRLGGSTFGACAKAQLGYGLVEADENCLRNALRSVDWETDSNASKYLEITRNDDELTPMGDRLLVAGQGASRDGSARSSLLAVVWTDPLSEFAVVVRATVTNYSSNLSQSRIDDHTSKVLSSSVVTVFDALKEVFGTARS